MRVYIRAVSILLMLALCPPALAASDPAAEAVLTSKGLTKVGLTYVLPGDIHFHDKMRAMRAAKSRMDVATARRADILRKIRAADDAFMNGESQRSDLMAKMQQVGKSATGTYNMYVDSYNKIGNQMRQIQRYLQDTQQELVKVVIPSDAYVAALTDLSHLMDTTAAQYQTLAADPAVRDALARLNANATAKVRLGPSLDFLTNLPSIRKEDASVISAPVKFDNITGTPELDVVLNGQLHVAMTLDSGASFVCLPWDAAQQLGLSPGPDDRTIELVIANGKKIKATLMSLKSVQLGQFIVHDVQCVVAPKSQKNSPCLLGGSFLQNFIYKMDLAGGQVFLTQINGESPLPDANPNIASNARPQPKTPVPTAGPVAAAGPIPVAGPAPVAAPDPEALAKAITVLETKPDDPEANLVVGRYGCFAKGEWSEGLPLLAKGSDAAAKNLAAQELKNPTDADGQMALADGWWAYAQTQAAPEKAAIQSHARDYYRKLLPGLKGLAKLKVETRLPDDHPAAAPVHLQKVAAPPQDNAIPAASLVSGPPLIPGKLLLIFPKNELATAESACTNYGLSHDSADSFDVDRDDYRNYSTIICGSNKMMYWKKHKDPLDFQHINAFIESGGHLVVFGSFNGDGMFQLKPYGINTGYYHGDCFASVPGETDLLMAGNEDLLPTDGLLHTAGNFSCKSPHVVLLARLKKTGEPDGPLMITMPWKDGRITYNLVEPNWKQPHDAFWLITATISWISRASPMRADQATPTPTRTVEPKKPDVPSLFGPVDGK